MSSRTKIYFDGGCRPNPGMMETAVIAGGREHVRRDLGHGTGMDAEWLALIDALALARSAGLADFILVGDAAAVIAQACGAAKCPPAYGHHLSAFRALTEDGQAPCIRHVKRTQNLAGIALAKLHPR